MTVIAAVVDQGRVYMGADSAALDAYNCITIRKDPKVFVNGGFLIGFTSSFRMGQLLMDAMFADPGNMDLFHYMRTQFVPVVRACLKDGGYTKVDNNRENGGEFLVGIRGRLFMVDSDFQVGEREDGFDSVGQGSQEALGVLYATRGMEPDARLRLAMKASERYRPGVRGPFLVLHEEHAL
jgi:hypothetical protein